MKQQLREEVGKRLRQFRIKKSLTQSELCSHFGMGHANYSRIERGQVFPGLSILVTLREKFNVSLDWLLCNKGEMFLADEASKDEFINLGDYQTDVVDLLYHMEHVPMIKHAILSYFLEYKTDHENIIRKVLNPPK